MAKLTRALAALCALATPASADTSFGAGSIIIPATSPYQTDCGAVAIYGVVYNILRANTWLAANGHGDVSVYYSYKESKKSPNRCTPTNLHVGPSYSGVSSPKHNDAKWNDGCDFELFSNSPVPVSLLTNTTATNLASDDATWATINTTSKTSGGTAVFPNWPAKTVRDTTSTSTDVHTVRYWGGSFVINDADAVLFRKLLQGTLIAKDIDGASVDFSSFKNGACSFGTSNGGKVNFHVANVAFTAPTPKIFTRPPPRLALLATDKGSKSGEINDGILQSYLRNGGLGFSGAQGCPINGYLATKHPSQCPSPNKLGQIYDVFDLQDLVNDKLTAVTNDGSPIYKVLWAPHWDADSVNLNSTEAEAIRNVVEYLDGQRGLMAECASIELFEGVPSGFRAPTAAIAVGQLQTCKGSTSCTGTMSYGLTKNSGSGSNSLVSDPGGVLRNCSDPDLSNGTDCAFYGYPGDSLSQVGDYRWHASAYIYPGLGPASQVADFKPNTGSMYKPGVKPLISGVSSLDKSKLTNASVARAMIRGDFATRSNKDNDTNKANILYLANHDQTDSVAGTKLVLLTLLQLGDPPVVETTTEITRSSPIAAQIESEDVLVQGTYESIVPAPPTRKATTDAESATFEFPFLLGHMRAIRTELITTDGVKFNKLPAGAVVFDAGTSIPPVTASGCSTNFAGTCRTVFTNTATGVRPPMVFVRNTDATLKSLIAPGLSATNQTTVVSRVLAGIPNSSGVYVPKLGGIDHSTVAVIGPSMVAGSPTRPQMIYFGAADGMIHAVCAKAVSGTGCTTSGRELWAYLPRTQLPRLRKNTQRIDGSPRVIDLFGDFDPTDGVTTRTFRTILLFQTGSGDASIVGETPSVHALDITNPFAPVILWEYTTPATRGTVELGQGLTVSAGRVRIGATDKLVAFAQTNNGGSTQASAGSVVVALDIETGAALWKIGAAYPAPRLAASGVVPAGGVPGGAVGVDRTGGGTITDVLYGTLYGEIYMVNAVTGANRHGTNPLFKFNADKKPFGVPPAIYSDGGKNSLFVAMVSGGYFDPAAIALWSGSAQQAIGINLATTTPSTPLTENSTLALEINLAAGEKGFSQASVIGNQLYFTTDSTDVNQETFATSAADTGRLYAVNLATGGSTAVIIAAGAGSVARTETTVFAASGTKVERIAVEAQSATSFPTNIPLEAKLSRKLWLRSL
jgi:hypothetical protein